MKLLLALEAMVLVLRAQSAPTITLVANAEGENPVIAPNTWVEVKGANLSKSGDSRIWQTSDFAKNQLPANLDGVSVTVNGKSAYVYYISPTQVNILTPPDAMTGPVAVVVTNNGAISASYTVQAQATSPSFFLFNGGPYVAATHVSGALLGPASLYPGSTTPAKPGETVVQWVRTDFRIGGEWSGDAIGDSFSLAGDQHWRHRGDGVICRPGRARRVSVQRNCSGQRAQR